MAGVAGHNGGVRPHHQSGPVDLPPIRSTVRNRKPGSRVTTGWASGRGGVIYLSSHRRHTHCTKNRDTVDDLCPFRRRWIFITHAYDSTVSLLSRVGTTFSPHQQRSPSPSIQRKGREGKATRSNAFATNKQVAVKISRAEPRRCNIGIPSNFPSNIAADRAAERSFTHRIQG